ncbi:MAG: glycosyl hydrolase 53 family protein [Calditrichaeota bacterium]|nr:glycosyl hydrolase 53 family protein [Calditrichota bacterium]
MRLTLLAIALSFCSAIAQSVHWGADLSFLPKLENHGAVYSRDGTERNALEIFRSAGVDVLRIRLWHTPAEPWSGLDSVLAFAERGHDLGFKILLDLHYSDTWADPAHQSLPAAWEMLSFAELEDSVYAYTNHVMLRFRDLEIPLYEVQIGNEIGVGMLWDWGRVGGAFDTPQQWSQLTDLLKAGVAGVRDSFPESAWPKVVIHHQEGGNSGACQWFFDHLIDYDVPFDVIGLSYYPWWHGTLDDLSANLANLATRYNKTVQVVETAYPWMTGWCDNENNIVWEDTPLLPQYPASETGQAFFLGGLRDRMETLPDSNDALICYWEPAWVPTATFGSPWENLALFECSGASQDAFNVFPGLTSGDVTLIRVNDLLRLRWQSDANLYYRIYASTESDGPFTTLLGTTQQNYFDLVNEFQQHNYRYFVVTGSSVP